MPTLRTERLLLRPFEERDLDEYAAIMANEEVCAYLGHPPMSAVRAAPARYPRPYAVSKEGEQMRRRLTVVSAREMPYPRQAVRDAIWNIQNIERTEVKADAVSVSPVSETHGTYRVRGRFAGVPWRGQFSYELNDGGFHSRTAGVAPEEAKVEGGFVVTPLAGGCTVIHYEQYVLAPWLRPLGALVRAYLHLTMRRELRDLERLVGASGSTGASPTPLSEVQALNAS